MKEVVVLPPPGPEEVRQTLAGRTAEVEERVRQAYARTLEPLFRAGLAVVAVGGFGRGELFPHSDVDLLLLAESDKNLPPRENISAFLQGLWDLGMRPSHSVHSVADCVVEHEDNAEFTVSLLDRRFLAGDAALYQTLEEKFRQFQARRGHSLARQIAGLRGRTAVQVSEHDLPPGAERQGDSRRPPRSADHALAVNAGTAGRDARLIGGDELPFRHPPPAA